jgi:hypothetical protein
VQTIIHAAGGTTGILSGCSNLQTLSTPFAASKDTNGQMTRTLKALFWGDDSNGGHMSPESLSTVFITGSDEIGSYAFRESAYLNYVTISSSVTSIGTEIFKNCSRLIEISFPNMLGNTLGISYFGGTVPSSLVSVTLSGGTQVSASMFKNLSSLQTIVLAQGITTIGDEAFSGCVAANINLPTTIISIGEEAFLNCKNLSEIEFNLAGVSIGNRAFMGCEGITRLDLSPATFIGYGAFAQCSSLAHIEIPFIGRGAAYSGLFGDIFNATLGNPAMPENNTITNSSVPSSLKTVVFWGDDLSANGRNGTFDGCSKITTVILSAKLYSGLIPSNTFNNCTSLSRIVVPQNLTNVNQGAFNGCNALTYIFFGGTSTDWNNILIANNNGRFSTSTRYYNGEWSYDPISGLPVSNP